MSQPTPEPSPQTQTTPAVQKATELMLYAGLAILGGGALFLIGRSVVRGVKYKATFNQTDDTRDPSYYALRLLQAMQNDNAAGFGTDEVMIRSTLKSIPHLKFWEKVKRAYNNLTKGGNLLADLDADLSRSEKRGVDMILAVLPKDEHHAKQREEGVFDQNMLNAWAERIKAACDHETSWFWPYGTDEEAIYEVFAELPGYQSIAALDQTYRKMFLLGLFEHLADELDGGEMMSVYQVIAQKNQTTVENALRNLSYYLDNPTLTT